jgi:hypothetical protein
VHNLAPGTPSALSPVHTARVPLQPVFECAVGADPEGDPQHFRLQIATDSNFANLVADLETAIQNLLTANQASIETDTTGFTARGSTISRDTTYFDTGNASLKVVTSGSAQNEGVELAPVNVLGGKSYAAQVKIRGAGYVRLGIEELDAAGNILRSTACNPVTLDGTQWQILSVVARTGTDCAKVRLVVLTSSVVGATFYCDSFMLVKGEDLPATFIPGGSFGNGTNSSLAGWEIYDGLNWVNMPATGAVAGTQKVRHTLQTALTRNQSYYWRMAAKDINGNYGSWTVPRIIRAGDLLQIQLKEPIETSAEAQRLLVFGYQNVAADGARPAILKVEAANNAFDTVPTWQDVTAAYLAREYVNLTNTIKTADKWGVNVRFTVWANDTLGPIELFGFGLAFD